MKKLIAVLVAACFASGAVLAQAPSAPMDQAAPVKAEKKAKKVKKVKHAGKKKHAKKSKKSAAPAA